MTTDWSQASVMPLPDGITEALFLSRIKTLARLLGLPTYHTHDSRRSDPGFPDLAILGPRALVLAELKSARGRVRPEQTLWLEGLARLPGVVVRPYLWRPSDWPQINRILADLAHARDLTP